MDNLNYEAFADNLNTQFHVSTDGNRIVDLTLAEVTELTLSGTQEQFSLVFRGPRDNFLGQGMRSLDHEKLGQCDLFLVPVREDAEGYYYEVVFNRFRK